MVDNTKKNEDADGIEVVMEGDVAAKPVAATEEDDTEIVIEDDTPVADQNRRPVPKEEAEAFDKDELEEYQGKVKSRLIRAKRLWHDERREKEQATRERDEAASFAKGILEENRRLKVSAAQGEETLVNTYRVASQLEMDAAKRAYKEAYEAGDSDRVVEAQEKMNDAGYKLAQAKAYRPSLQTGEKEVEQKYDAPPVQRLDPKTASWQAKNTWYGTDEEMSALALGLHQKLEKQNGKEFVGSDDYWKTIDSTMRRRFSEYFEEEKPEADKGKSTSLNGTRPATVVAPVSRSTPSKKVVLSATQLAIAKKLGVTPLQYAQAQYKVENQ